jgi:hypothetical protein
MAITRKIQYAKFNSMVASLLNYAAEQNISVRIGECFRSADECVKLAKAGKGIINSKHKTSLAIDLWINNGIEIDWNSKDYYILGQHWEDLGGVFGGAWKKKDLYHFEYPEKPAKI